MDKLRWILLLVGLIVLGIIYLVSRNKKRSPTKVSKPDEEHRLDPLFDTIAIVDEPAEPVLPDDFELIPNPDVMPVNKPSVAARLSEEESRSSVLSNLTHDTETLNHLLSQKLSPEDSSVIEAESVESVQTELPVAETFSAVVNQSESESAPELEPELEPKPEVVIEEKVISLNIIARGEMYFRGADMLRIFKLREYEYGDMEIFHSYYEGEVVFSIVNLVEPGWFDLDAMDGFSTSGIALFMQLPGPLTADVAFDVMLNEADILAQELGGQVSDAAHQPLTEDQLQNLREEMADYAERQQ